VDAKLLYWTWAFGNFVAVAVCAGVGVQRIRAANLRGHRRMMLSSAGLVLLFLVGSGPALLPEPSPGAARMHHRWAGRIAVWSAMLALVSSGVVLIGMYARA
jgi:hypothetical protein